MTSAPEASAVDAKRSGKFEKNPRHERATYGIAYPTSETKFDTKADLERFTFEDGARGKLDAKKVYWRLSGATVKDVVFRECNFHTTHGVEASLVTALTFEKCDFNSCNLGFVLFRRTTFRGCNFSRCEMSRTEFDECTFDNCRFENCTPWEAVLQRTLVDPSAFLTGFAVPPENLRELLDEKRADIEERRLRERVVLAEQLLRSNEERGNAIYCDRALYQSRQAAFIWRQHERRSKSWWQRARDLPGFALSFAYLRLTLGGTSLTRLSALAAFFCLGFAALLLSGAFGITFRGAPTGTLSFLECLSAAASLFFAFGYTNLAVSGGLGNVIVTIPPMLCMAWIAIVLAVIVRRAYR